MTPHSRHAPSAFAAIISSVALFASGLASAQSTTQALRIEDAVQLALSRNERARIADLNVAVSRAAVDRARAGFLPVANVTANDTLRPVTADRTGVTPSANTGNAAITVTQPLINAPAWPLYSQAKENLEGTRAQTIDDKRVLAFDAARAFFGVLTQQAVLQAADRRLGSARANLENAQARVAAQLASSNDVTRALINSAASEREVELDRGNVDGAVVQLGFVINSRVTGSLLPPQETLRVARQPAGELESLVKFAFDHRPDVLARRHFGVAAHDFAREPMMRLVPVVGLTGQATATTAAPPTGRWNDESLALTLTWPLYDAGIRYADKRSREASADIADLNTQALLRSVDSQVRSAVVALRSAQAALGAAQKAMDASRLGVTETEILYRQGLARAIELVDANDQRFGSEVAYASAEYQMALAYLGLREALGLDALGTELR